MTTFFVTRHSGAVDWSAARGLEVDRLVSHLELDDVQAGDVVVGTLPVNLAAGVCQRGGQYLHLSLRIPPEFRGVELTADQMDEYGATIEEYRIERVP